MSDPRQDYAEALAAYRDAMARLREARRHIPQTSRDRRRQRLREEREAQRAHYLANKDEIDAISNAQINRITAKAVEILHQKANTFAFQSEIEEAGTKVGESLRIRLPVTYTVGRSHE